LCRGNAVLLQAIDQYEQDLKAESFLTESVLPPIQVLLVHAGSGNEEGYVGRRRWLFYRPGIDYCTGPGFLNERQMVRRADRDTEWQSAPQPDPRAAILQFHRQLAERRIRLVLMPTLDKATIHPEKFSSRYEGRAINVHNPSYQQLLNELRADGVLVCDVTDALARYRDDSGNAAYLATDTHWRPEAMELAAAELAGFIQEVIEFDGTAVDGYRHQPSRDVRNLGDIARMLKLRLDQRVFDEEVVTIRPVSDVAGMPWRPDPAAEVLVLGDSFANIYSLEEMNWGCAAGLVEQLSLALKLPVDAILRNDNGAYAARELLSRELAQGNDRLDGKKVVVWQFAARELAVGDWRLLDMTFRPSSLSESGPLTETRELIVSGTIAAKSPAPRAGQIPYAHHVFTLDLTDLQVHQGTLADSKIAVYLFSMRNYQNTAAFSWPVGKRLKLKLRPWRPDFFARYGRINRSETKDAALTRPWWGDVVE
jgi:alginate O-acetyltransferase complex protein AlgJ